MDNGFSFLKNNECLQIKWEWDPSGIN